MEKENGRETGSFGKRSRVLAKPRKRPLIWPLAGLAALLVVGLVLTFTVDPLGLLGRDKDVPAFKLSPRQYDANGRLSETPVTPEFKDGKIYVDLAAVDKGGLVDFEIPNQTVRLSNGATFDSLPVIAYVAPTGKVVAAVSFCEPCAGNSFHITGNRLVCNVCGTEWSLEKLQGLSGGCTKYPPEQVSFSVEGGRMVLDEQQLRSWVPRL